MKTSRRITITLCGMAHLLAMPTMMLAQTCESPGGAPVCTRLAVAGQIISKPPGFGGCPPHGVCMGTCSGGGMHNGQPCEDSSDCGTGICTSLSFCVGGPYDGAECIDDTQCASQTCTYGEHCDPGDSYLETNLSNEGDEECLRETIFHPASSTNNRLEHKWVFKYVPQGNQCLTFEGHRTGSDDFDWLECDCNRFTGGCISGVSNCDAPDGFIQLSIPPIDNPYPDETSEAFIKETADNDREFHILLSDVQVAQDSVQDEVLVDFLKLVTYPSAEFALSDHQTGPGSIVSGDYTDTAASENTREVLQEGPSGTNSKLKHVWRFDNVPAGGVHELVIEGRRPANGDGDDFEFGWNTTGGMLYQMIPGAVIDYATEPSGGERFFLAGESFSGTVYVLVQDTIAAGSHLATVEIDRLAIVTIPDCTFCGDGTQDPGETCDNEDLGAASCADVGCANGTVSCLGDCSADYSQCTDCCDLDGTCEPGENCNSCAQDCLSASLPGAQCGNGTCEIGDGEDCLSCPSDCNGQQAGNPANRFCCGDGAGQSPVGCGDGRCTSGGFECTETPNPPVNYCCGDGIQQEDEGDGTICDGNY